ncbi:(2Fe-2S)-binding protein [Nocardia neocaledoniensis]
MSCCLVYEVPGCQMCTSCPKRPAAERAALLAEA